MKSTRGGIACNAEAWVCILWEREEGKIKNAMIMNKAVVCDELK